MQVNCADLECQKSHAKLWKYYIHKNLIYNITHHNFDQTKY